jgi:F-type H+-transporting ATPase subunit a
LRKFAPKNRSTSRIFKAMILKNAIKSIALSILTLFSFSTVFAGHSDKKEEKFNVGELIMHHVKDAHEWHVIDLPSGPVSISLPIILIDGGIKVFSSSAFYHGVEKSDTSGKYHYLVAGGNGAGYAMFHEKIYKLNAEGELHFEGEHPHNSMPLDFSITKNTASLLLGALLISLIMFTVAKYYKKNGAVAPKGVAKFIEPLIVFVRDDIAKANIDHHKYKKFVPYLLTIFFFIWINNMMGLIPVLGSNLTGNIAVTLVLAVMTLLMTVFSGNKNYWKHIFATPGVPIPLLLIMVPIEIVGIFTKPFALMVRLFANITAGHIIILALVSIIFLNKSATWGLLSVPMALFISVLEILVAFLQAYLFAMLSALFIGAAVEEAHH